MSHMTLFLSFFVLSALSSLFYMAEAQGRAPHGLAYENPIAFSPSAFDFFHPDSQSPSSEPPCAKSKCAPIPLSAFSSSSAVVKATPAQESKFSTYDQSSRSPLGAGGIAGIVFGFVFAVLLAMGVYYVVITRKTNINRSNSVQPDSC